MHTRRSAAWAPSDAARNAQTQGHRQAAIRPETEDKQAKKGGNVNPNELQQDLFADKTVDGAGILKKLPAIIGFGGMGIGAGMLEDTEALMNKYEMNM